MKIKTINYQDVSIVIIYDPIEVSKLSLDALKGSSDIVSSISKEIVILESPKEKRQITIQTSRLEFSDMNTISFETRDFNYLKDFFNNLSTSLMIKAFGINFKENVLIEEIGDVGKFLAEKFLKDKSDIEQKLEKPIFSHSIRLFCGSPKEFFDLRLFPVEFEKDIMNVHFHYHYDGNIADIETLIQKIAEKRKLTVEELPKILEKVLGV